MQQAPICFYILLVILLLLGCSPSKQPTATQIQAPLPEQLASERPVDWSQVNLPAIGETGKWALTPGKAMDNAVFSADGKTIYGIGSNNYSLLRKSTDGGHSWVDLPAFEELGLCEAFFMKMVNDDLFIGSSTYGIYHSADGGNTFDKLPSIVTDPGVWGFDATVDASGKPVLLAGIGNGLWRLSYPYQEWVDMRVGNVDGGGSGYFVWQMAFSPDYAQDGQILALVGDGRHLKVTFKYEEEAWGERIADAYIPDAETQCDLKMAFSRFVFPDDYDSKKPVTFIGAGLNTEVLTKASQYADLYRIDGRLAGSGTSSATDLDVGGKGTSTPVISVALKGPADSATILAGGIGQVYRSADSGRSWQAARKPPTGGAILWLAFNPSDNEGSSVYALSSSAGCNVVPRGADVPVGESAFSYSSDGGVTWSQLSQIDTTRDEIISHAVSPKYDSDQTMFLLTRSSHLLSVSLNEDEIASVTREPDEPGVMAEVYITPHQGNPPTEQMRITNGDTNAARTVWDTGTGPALVLDDEHPSATIKVLPLTENKINDLIDYFKSWLPEYSDPWYKKEWLALTKKPSRALLYVQEGNVTVAKGAAPEVRMSVDGHPDDWQGIEPVVTDPSGDAPSADADLKALYTTNDDGFLYLMVEFYGNIPHSHCEILADLDLDGVADHKMFIWSPDEPVPHQIHIKSLSGAATPNDTAVDIDAFSEVVEARLPLSVFGADRFGITDINVMNWTGNGYTAVLDSWEGSSEVELQTWAAPSGTPITFPSTESLWKTTDGGATWERILTSGLNLSVDGKQVKVGSLGSVALSVNFAQDDTVYVYEGGDSSRVWASTDGGTTFVLCK